MLDSQVFIAGDTYDDCYTALEKILKSFKVSLFQANGQWNIVSWFDAVPKVSWSYSNNNIPGFVYDETWASAGTTVLNNNFYIGPDPQLTRPIAGLTEGALRGYKFTKRTFDYKQPKYLLRNYDLQEVGALIRQYVSGTDTYYEYVALGWEESWNTPEVERFIRVVKNNFDTEIDRCLVLRGATGDSPRSVQGTPFEISEGDKIKFSFSFQTSNSQPCLLYTSDAADE